MKKILIFLLMCYLAQGCILIRGWEYYAVDEPGGRAYLKDMKFKDSFEPEMANYIDDNVVYVWDDRSNRPSFSTDSDYIVIRFFKTGQWISFGCDEVTPEHCNNLNQSSYVGYYNYRNGFVLQERPNFDFSQSGTRRIDKAKILPSGDLFLKYKTLEITFKKTEVKGLKPLLPDW